MCGMVYSRQQGAQGGGCGGGAAFDMSLTAAFAVNVGTGAVAIAQINPATSGVGALPVALVPGHGLSI